MTSLVNTVKTQLCRNLNRAIHSAEDTIVDNIVEMITNDFIHKGYDEKIKEEFKKKLNRDLDKLCFKVIRKYCKEVIGDPDLQQQQENINLDVIYYFYNKFPNHYF